jgi:hypothetical protein
MGEKAMTTPTDELVERLPELLAKTTRGPWRVEDKHRYVGQPDYPSFNAVATVQVSNVARWEANAQLIALAPAMAARLVELQSMLDRVRGVLEYARSWFDANDCGKERVAKIDAALAEIRGKARG